MIRTHPRTIKPLAPRLSVFGHPRPWLPAPNSALTLPVASTLLNQPQHLPPGEWLMSASGSAVLPILATPPAVSVVIGWFEALRDPTVATGPRTESEGPPHGISLPRADTQAESPDVTERLAAILQPPAEALFSIHGVLDWPAPLHAYQQEGVSALLSRRELLLADDMGLGKTIQALAALRILFFREEIETVLIVCPASLVRQWRKEIERWAPELSSVSVTGTATERATLWRLPAHLKIVSYDTLRGDVMDVRDSPALRNEWSVVILDEASRIKNRETGISMACKRLPRRRRWALTGTPLENRLDDVASILEFLMGDPGARGQASSTPTGIRAQLKEVQLRRKKEDVLKDLPPKQVIEQVIDLLPAQRVAYDRAEQEGVVRLEHAGPAVTVTHVLELISRLKQICNNDPESGESAKLADIEERLTMLVAEGHRALVFSQFTDRTFGVDLIADRLRSFQPITYTGAMSAQAKAAAVERFFSDDRHKALILSLRAGGVGLNLQAASYVFHLDRWWNPAIEDQADSRAHRMGQTFPVTVFRYVCAGTIEERIDEKLKAKRQLFLEIVDDVSLDLATALTEDELFGLFGLRVPRRKTKTEPTEGEQESFESMSGVEFEEWLAVQLREKGFAVETTPSSRDGGVDLIASRIDELQIESRLYIQCKNTQLPTGVAVIRELRGVVPDRSPGVTPVAACPAGFTADAVAFAKSVGVRLWSATDLRELCATSG